MAGKIKAVSLAIQAVVAIHIGGIQDPGPHPYNVPFKVQPNTMNDIWVSIDAKTQLIQVGIGRHPSQESMCFIYKDNRLFVKLSMLASLPGTCR